MLYFNVKDIPGSTVVLPGDSMSPEEWMKQYYDSSLAALADTTEGSGCLLELNAALAEEGMACSLEQFLTPEALNKMSYYVRMIEAGAYTGVKDGDAWWAMSVNNVLYGLFANLPTFEP